MTNMLEPDLVGYLCNCLEEGERRRVESQLAADPDLRRRLQTLQQRLSPLDECRTPEPPPADLVLQTLARVAEKACCGRSPLPNAPAVSPRNPSHGRPWWRRIDVAVAASVVLTTLGLLLPATLYLRRQGLQVECQNNLRDLWQGLQAYQVQHGQLPDINTTARPVAGMIVPILREAGVLPERAAEICPGSAPGQPCLHLSLHDLANLTPQDFAATAPSLMPGYAFSLGFRDEAGRVHGPDAMLRHVGAQHLPILADAPAIPVAFGNSPNHTGNGQNVLFFDGGVRFQNSRHITVRHDDIYLNHANRVAAGFSPQDIVLGVSSAAP